MTAPEVQGSDLTESLPAVPELQPLDSSVGAVRTHDRPGDK